jgi:hypothetical protein
MSLLVLGILLSIGYLISNKNGANVFISLMVLPSSNWMVLKETIEISQMEPIILNPAVKG